MVSPGGWCSTGVITRSSQALRFSDSIRGPGAWNLLPSQLWFQEVKRQVQTRQRDAWDTERKGPRESFQLSPAPPMKPRTVPTPVETMCDNAREYPRWKRSPARGARGTWLATPMADLRCQAPQGGADTTCPEGPTLSHIVRGSGMAPDPQVQGHSERPPRGRGKHQTSRWRG